ncbi:cytochrome P450 71A1 [Selaginella moellendorffii]|uniref:cytochrome P450 71A1 n=1 Tax=Selaginella moellendorffii TaxID=88036 RepID=UPI000D1C39F6|nr:cytochrome P450 71A1 [Selaginella moellendorffii]|eukprot:XP_024537726.1 cytochrome P450 71A1 [Selaginella moellendorffii]
MEFHYWSLSIFSLLAILGTVWCLVRILYPSKRYKGLPCPRMFPVIGHLHLLRRDPHRVLLALAREFGRCMYLKLGQYPCLVLSSAEVTKEALQGHDIAFSSRPALSAARIFGFNGSGVLWAPYGEHLKMVRKLCILELLTPRRVDSFESIRAEERSRFVSQLRDIANRNEAADLTAMLLNMTLNIMMRIVLGTSSATVDKETSTVKELIAEAFVSTGEFLVGDYLPWLSLLDTKKKSRMKALKEQMSSYLQKQIEEHHNQNDKSADFMTLMLQSPEIGSNDVAIKAVIADMIAGGTDTSAITVEWALAELLKHPDLMAKAQEELDNVLGRKSQVQGGHLPKLEYLAAVIKETLRLHPPGPLLIHETTQNCQLKNVFVPQKTLAFINLYALGRDESTWVDPLKFDPNRFIDKKNDGCGHDFGDYLPFGAGRRGCPGMHLALTVVSVTLASLLYGFNWKMPDGMSFEHLDMSEGAGFTIPRALPLKLVPLPR